MSDLKATLKECLKRSGWDFDLPEDTESLRDLGLDSLAFALWVVEVERSVGVKLPPARLTDGQIDTVDDLASLVAELKGKTK